MISADELLEDTGLMDSALAESCRYAVAKSGKQLRPRLVLEASHLGTENGPLVRTAARAVELLHIATLAHDDVIDDSPVRRGEASLDGKHGGFAASYAGAWLFGTAVELAAECGQETVEWLADAACQLCDGEMAETQDLYNPERTEERYMAAISGKTASLFSLSARLGGLTGGASSAVCDRLGHYGHLLGMAFQLADDILDLIGDWKGLKRPGDDLRHGVFTLPVIYAVQENPSLSDMLTKKIEDDAVRPLIDRLRHTDGLELAYAKREEYCQAARAIADELQAPWLDAFVDIALTPLEMVRGL
jgi:heptaprenyl diphosphate synthase